MNKKLIKNNNSELLSGKIPNRNTDEGTTSPESYNTPISFKVTSSQKAYLESEAQKRGITTSVYARERLFQPPHQDIVIAEGGDILQKMALIYNYLQYIREILNSKSFSQQDVMGCLNSTLLKLDQVTVCHTDIIEKISYIFNAIDAIKERFIEQAENAEDTTEYAEDSITDYEEGGDE